MPCTLTSIAHSRIPGRAGLAHTGMSGPRSCERGPGHAAGARRGRERRPANATRDQGTGEAASETFACMVAFVLPTGPPGETFACMHALVSLEVGTHLRETFACMHAFVSLGANGSRNRGADGQRCQQRRVAGSQGRGERVAGRGRASQAAVRAPCRAGEDHPSGQHTGTCGRTMEGRIGEAMEGRAGQRLNAGLRVAAGMEAATASGTAAPSVGASTCASLRPGRRQPFRQALSIAKSPAQGRA